MPSSPLSLFHFTTLPLSHSINDYCPPQNNKSCQERVELSISYPVSFYLTSPLSYSIQRKKSGQESFIEEEGHLPYRRGQSDEVDFFHYKELEWKRKIGFSSVISYKLAYNTYFHCQCIAILLPTN